MWTQMHLAAVECNLMFLIRNNKNELNIYFMPCSFLEYLAMAGVGVDENMQTIKIHYLWSADASALWTMHYTDRPAYIAIA